MSTLPTPSIINIKVFDPNYDYSVEFLYTGNQTVKNRAIITDNDTYEIVYDNTETTLKLSHTIPSGTLLVGKTYTIQMQVFDINGNSSNLSSEVLFSCCTTPLFTLSNTNGEEINRAANVTLDLSFSQSEGDTLKSYQYYMYDYGKSLISSTDIYYTEENLRHSFYGLENNRTYYFRCIGESSQGFMLDTGYLQIDVVYNTIPANVLFQLENHRNSGYISLTTNMIIIGYDIENGNYVFENGALTLWDNSLTYNSGFTIEDDFILFLEAKQLPLGTFLKTSNDEFTLSILNVCDVYYCEFKSRDYVIYVPLPKVQLTTANGDYLTNDLGQKLEIINMSYDDKDFVIFEVKRVNNIYNLRAYYKADF